MKLLQRIHCVREGFSFWAFSFTAIYFLFKGYFTGFFLIATLMGVTEILYLKQIFGTNMYISGVLSIMIVCGFFPYWLAKISLYTRGYVLCANIYAHDAYEAQSLFLSQYTLDTPSPTYDNIAADTLSSEGAK